MLRKLIPIVFALVLAPSAVNAQCSGQAPAYTYCGNPTGSLALPGWKAFSGIPVDLDIGSTTITGGTTGRLLYDNAGVLGEYALVPLAFGGTSAALAASNGGIFYSTATAAAILSGTATARQMLQSGASGAPAWSTATWPATTTINQLLYSSSANTVAGLATANSSVLVTNGSGVPAWSTSLPFSPPLVVGTTTITGGTSLGLLYNNAGVLGNATAASIQTSGGYQFFGVGDAIATGISRSTGTKPTALMLSRLVNWSNINDATVVDYTTLTAQDSVSNQYSSFAAYTIMTNTAFNWNHLYGFEDLNIIQGSGTLTNNASFYSSPTINGTTTNRKAFWAANAGGAGTLTNQYGFTCDALTRGSTANWCFFATASTPSYFGGNVLIGTAGTAPATPALTINKNAASPLSPVLAGNLLQITNADGSGTNIELNAFGTGSVPSVLGRAARGTKASPTAIQTGDVIGSWATAGYGTSAFDDFTAAIQNEALENFTNTANGSALDFYTNAIGATTLTKRLRIATGLIVGSSGTDPGAGSINATTSSISPIHAAPGVLTFQSNGSTFAGKIDASQRWLLGPTSVTSQPRQILTVTENTAAPAIAPPAISSLLYVYHSDGANTNITVDSYGTAVNPGMIFRAARGTAAAPTQSQSGDFLFAFNTFALNNASAFQNAAGTGIFGSALTENCTTTACGTKWVWYATATGSVSTLQKMQVQDGLSVGTTSDPGAGMIYTNAATFMIRTKTSYSNGAGAVTGTLTNAPAATNPTKWIPVDDNGTTRYIPAW